MLAIKSQSKIVQKILQTKAGEFVLATFFVIEREGEFDVRLIDVKPIDNSEKSTNYKLKTKNFLCLSGNCQQSPAVISYRKNFYSVVSPFFNIFEFLVSQPTRAPSL